MTLTLKRIKTMAPNGYKIYPLYEQNKLIAVRIVKPNGVPLTAGYTDVKNIDPDLLNEINTKLGNKKDA